MVFCTSCGEGMQDGTKFCRLCGEQVISQVLLERLKDDSRRINASKTNSGQRGESNKATSNTLDAVEEMRRLADEAAARRWADNANDSQ